MECKQHYSDNQGFCHTCGISMADADKEFTREEIVDCLKDLYLAIDGLTISQRKDTGLYSMLAINKACEIIRSEDK